MQKGITSMNINECYQAMGADYEEVFGRLRSERLITKFVLKFPGDPSFSQLQSTLEEKNYTKEELLLKIEQNNIYELDNNLKPIRHYYLK